MQTNYFKFKYNSDNIKNKLVKIRMRIFNDNINYE